VIGATVTVTGCMAISGWVETAACKNFGQKL